MGIRVGMAALLVAAALTAATAGGPAHAPSDVEVGAGAPPAITSALEPFDVALVLSSALVRPEPGWQAEQAVRTARLATDLAELDGEVSVAVRDVETGRVLVAGETIVQAASTMKVDILAAFLRENGPRPEREGRALARAMISHSDNAAADAMLEAVSVETVNEFLTDARADTRLTSREWGRTSTTAEDRLRTLDATLGEDSLLDDRSQLTVRRLMSRVIDEQRIGVSAAADDPDGTPLKAGYVPDDRTDRWYVSSMGEVQADGRTYLVAVVSSGQHSLEDGAEQVERAAQLALAEIADLSRGAPAA